MDSTTAKIRIAVIGAGIFVQDTYIPNINSFSGRVQLTAILSRSIESVEAALRLLSSGTDAVLKFTGASGEAEFFARARDVCDAVVVAVPIPMLASYVERCLQAGLHVLSEKPVAMTSTEARRLITVYRGIQVARPGPILWHVAENYRLEPAVKYASSVVKARAIRPKSFTLIALRQQSTTSKYAVTSWRAKPQYNGSYVMDGGIHFVAMLRSVLGGEISEVNSIFEETSVVEVASCGACRAAGVLGTFQIRYGAFPSVLCRLDVFWDDAAMSIIQHRGEGYEITMTGCEPKRFPFGGLQAEFSAWLDSISTGSVAAELTPEEALCDLIAVEQFCHSAV
jgi:predicted dehydrogenase